MSAQKQNNTAMKKNFKKQLNNKGKQAKALYSQDNQFAENNMIMKSSFSQETESLLGNYNGIILKLRHYYETLQKESVPDRFLDLLAKLEKVELTQENEIMNSLETKAKVEHDE